MSVCLCVLFGFVFLYVCIFMVSALIRFSYSVFSLLVSYSPLVPSTLWKPIDFLLPVCDCWMCVGILVAAEMTQAVTHGVEVGGFFFFS